MRIPELKRYLLTIKPSRAVLILGPPGIGKSVAVREFAEEEAGRLGKEFIDYSDDCYSDIIAEPGRYYVFADFRLTECEPSDLLGIPRDVGDAVAYKPLLWAKALSATKHGMLFLDELTNVNRPDLQSVAYKLVLDRKAGFLRINGGVRIIAAGNRPEESAIANRLPAPLTSRFHVIHADAPTVEEWVAWMDEKIADWDKRVLGYLVRFREDFLKTPDEPETLEPYPTPRSWTWLAEELPATPRDFVKAKVFGYVGREVGHKFLAFIESPVPEPDELLRRPEMFAGLSLDVKYLATVMVANYATQSQRAAIADVVRFLKAAMESGGEFLALFFLVSRGSKRALDILHEIATKHPDLRKEVANLGYLISETN